MRLSIQSVTIARPSRLSRYRATRPPRRHRPALTARDSVSLVLPPIHRNVHTRIRGDQSGEQGSSLATLGSGVRPRRPRDQDRGDNEGMGDLPLMAIGESFIGTRAEAAHINTVLGRRDGPVGTAWATALATPRQGHTPFIAVVRPGLPAKPLTLFVTKATVADSEHSDLIWGAAQAGVAGGVADAVSEGVISAADADRLLLIAAVWVSPAARHANTVYANNRTATTQALRSGAMGLPQVTDVLG